MDAKNSDHQSAEEVGARTRLGAVLNNGQITCESKDEKQRRREEIKQTTSYKIYIAVYSNKVTTLPQKQNFRVYIYSVDSMSRAEEYYIILTNIEKQKYGGEQIAFVEPSGNDGDHFYRKLEYAPKLEVEVEGVDTTKCHSTAQKHYTFTKMDLENSNEPRISFALTCNDQYAKRTASDFDVIATGLNENGEEIYKEKTKYPLQFNGEALRKTPSERPWQDQASCSIITKQKGNLEELLPYIEKNIQEFGKVLKNLHDSGVAGLNQRGISWQVGELLHHLLCCLYLSNILHCTVICNIMGCFKKSFF